MHGPSGDIFDSYTTLTWPARCAETAKLRIELPAAPEPDPPPPTMGRAAVAIERDDDASGADDLLQSFLQSVATAVAGNEKGSEPQGLGAFSLQRGGRDLKANFIVKIIDNEDQPSAFTTTRSVEVVSGEQERAGECSSVVSAILPSVSTLDPVAKALLVVITRWAASGDVRQSLLRVLAEND